MLFNIAWIPKINQYNTSTIRPSFPNHVMLPIVCEGTPKYQL